MYVVIRQTRLARAVEKVVERTRNYILPLVQGQPGFQGYCGFIPETGDAAFSVNIFDDRDAAMAAHHRVREWIDKNMRDLLPNWMLPAHCRFDADASLVITSWGCKKY
jgi:hypothetical protein